MWDRVRAWLRSSSTQAFRSWSFTDVWGSGQTPTTGSQDQALQLAPVYGAVRLLASNIASLPLQTFRDTGDGRTRIDDPLLVTAPSAHGVRFSWMHRLVTSLALRGNAYGLIVARDASLIPTQVEWLHPDDVAIVDNRAITSPQWLVLGRPIDRRDLLHIPYFTVSGQVLGLSVINAFRTLFDAGHNAVSFGAEWFANGSVPSAVLETDQPVDQTQAQTIKERFRAAAHGRQPIVLGNGVSYKPISVTPEESQFLESIRANASQIATIFGVPAEMVGGETGGSMTYANVEQQALNFVTFSLLPYLTLIEESLSTLLPRKQYVRFNADALIRSSTLDRYHAHNLAVGKWKTPNEIRRLEQLPPISSGNALVVASAPAPAHLGVPDDH